MVTFLNAMYKVADYHRCFQKLSGIGKLDYIYDLCQILSSKLKSDGVINLIVEAFKEAVSSLQFTIAMGLYDRFDILLETNHIELTPFLIQ
mmetsp:Transcript_26723/g.35769  ORF Transcript_26723/g.35769 Transcript_26723/m.35769 type:complete len:91 (+) Transcript_26723:127-399(+)